MSSLAGMVAGFNLAAVSRLTQTKNLLGKKYVKILDELKLLFDPTSSYKNIRNHMAKIVQPAIPYMFLFLFYYLSHYFIFINLYLFVLFYLFFLKYFFLYD